MARAKATQKREIVDYEHTDKTRKNNPPVGLVDPDSDPFNGRTRYAYDPHLDPQLFWAGKAERISFEIPNVSLHVHERIEPTTIIEAVRKKGEGTRQISLFESIDRKLPLREAIEFYKHENEWSNRLIAGDSLLVMNSLLQKEGLGGQVQMIYLDPPYGIRYGSNFQPFVNRRKVADKDEDLTSEPEMVKAFRDTWELGIHSYLSYLQDRLLLSRDLLTESGSIFVQINDENVHRVRALMDEVFGARNFVSLITFKTTTNLTGKLLGTSCDYLCWYTKNIEKIKYRNLYYPYTLADDVGKRYTRIELPNETRRTMTTEERRDSTRIPEGSRPYRHDNLTSQSGTEKTRFAVEFDGTEFRPPQGRYWTTNAAGFERLRQAKRLVAPSPNSLNYIRYLSDFPWRDYSNVWTDTQTGAFTEDKIYVVQTNTKVVERCILMTTDPGDMVFDPTCGSGTTAVSAEKWGRRWVTCDTSRVSIALAKQRLMTNAFDYYQLQSPGEGIRSGFRYESATKISLKSIANAEPPEQIHLLDRPMVDAQRVRVTGPFTVEAVPAPAVVPITEAQLTPVPDGSIARMTGSTARLSDWIGEVAQVGIKGRGGQRIQFSRVEPSAGIRWIQALGETREEKPQPVAFSFGHDFAPLEQRHVAMALEEAKSLVPKPKLVVFCSFQFDPEAAKDIDEAKWPGVTLLKVQMNTDLLTDDLKKKRSSNESFLLVGQPDVRIIKQNGRRKVSVEGFDYYNAKTGAMESGGPERIAMWLLDTDYDGRSLFPRQVFFPMAAEGGGWGRLARSLKAEIDEEKIEAYRGTISLPFEIGQYKRAAVKIVDDRGIESIKIVNLE